MSTYKGTAAVLSATTKIVDTDIVLNSGHKMPVIGFGTYTIQGRDNIFKAIDAALKAGYRSFDTATVYSNESEIGAALKEYLPKYNLKRENVFITSKLAPRDQGKDKVKKAVEESLRKLGTDYLDLYLIHWPGSSLPSDSDQNPKLRRESWEGLEQLVKQNKLRSIGVSNYLARHLKELLQSSTITPAVNQVELHPHWQQEGEFYNICGENNILIQAYSSLGGHNTKDVLNDATVKSVAAKLNVTPAQVLLRWGLQRGAGIIPKSLTPDRIKQNSELDFELSKSDMELINNIGIKAKYAWNPNTVL